MAENPKKPNAFLKMLLWWQIDSTEVQKQVKEYGTLSIWHSSRKVSALLLAFSFVITVAFVAFGLTDTGALWDAVLLALLSIFVYRGYQAALICAMILWTYEKGFIIFSAKSNPIVHIIWWSIYMSQFFMAFRVEQARTKQELPPPPSGGSSHSLSAPISQITPQGWAEEPISLSNSLRELKRLKDDGVISESDFENKKQELLRKII